MELKNLPMINAILNGCSAFLLMLGFISIKRKKIGLHRIFMGSAFFTSCLFLGSYLTYHFFTGSTPFLGQGWIRALYFGILLTHTILAALVAPLAITILIFALKKNWARHKKWARWVWPVWMYVSITGIVIYWMLYQM